MGLGSSPSTSSSLLSSINASIDRANTIINSEKSRLNAKSSSIKQAQDNQNRLILLNQNYSSRVNQYIKMILVVVLMLAAILIIRNYMQFLPAAVVNMLSIIVVSLTLIYLFMLYNDLMNRNNLDYNQVEQPPPLNSSSKQKTINANALAGDLIGEISMCAGPACCATGTRWDDNNSQCIPSSSSTSSRSGGIQHFQNMTDPYTDFEFNSYSPY